MMSGIEAVVVVFIVLIMSADGFMAIHGRKKRVQRNRFVQEKRETLNSVKNMEPYDELNFLRERKESIRYPEQVIARGGFTGRGSPLLARNRFAFIDVAEKEIERIIG